MGYIESKEVFDPYVGSAQQNQASASPMNPNETIGACEDLILSWVSGTPRSARNFLSRQPFQTHVDLRP